jgi:hypothetical protein
MFPCGRGDKDVKKVINKTRDLVLDFSEKINATKNLKLKRKHVMKN